MQILELCFLKSLVYFQLRKSYNINMRNIAKVIDRIIKLEPSLEKAIAPIKTKYKRYPKRERIYWAELLDFLNSTEVTPEQRDAIRDVFIRKKTRKKKKYTFEHVSPNDEVIGTIPEYLSDKLKRLDIQGVDLAKKSIEANMTGNSDLFLEIRKRSSQMEIKQKKIWHEIRDMFDLWKIPENIIIKQKGSLLVLTKPKNIVGSINRGTAGQLPKVSPSSVEILNTKSGPLMRMSPDIMKAVFNFLNIQPPPGLFDNE